MLKHGKDITKIREQFRKKALDLEKSTVVLEDGINNEEINKVQTLAIKMERGYFKGRVLIPKTEDTIP